MSNALVFPAKKIKKKELKKKTLRPSQERDKK